MVSFFRREMGWGKGMALRCSGMSALGRAQRRRRVRRAMRAAVNAKRQRVDFMAKRRALGPSVAVHKAGGVLWFWRMGDSEAEVCRCAWWGGGASGWGTVMEQ